MMSSQPCSTTRTCCMSLALRLLLWGRNIFVSCTTFSARTVAHERNKEKKIKGGQLMSIHAKCQATSWNKFFLPGMVCTQLAAISPRGIEDHKQKSEDKYNQIHFSHTPNTVRDSLRLDKTFERPAPYKMHLHSKSATRSRAIVVKIIVRLLISLYMLRFNTKGFKFVSYLL